MHWVTALLDGLHGWLAYGLVFGLVFGETALLLGFVLPGETALLLGGLLAFHHAVSLPVLLAVAVLAAVAGDAVGFEIGRHFGPRLRRTRVGQRIGPDRFNRADALLYRWGGRAILAGRFTAIARALVPTLAGASGMTYRRFIGWNALGGLLWGGGAVLAGYFAGSSLATITHWLHFTWLPIGVAILLAVLVTRHRRRNPVAEQPTFVDPPVDEHDTPASRSTQAADQATQGTCGRHRPAAKRPRTVRLDGRGRAIDRPPGTRAIANE